MRLIELTHNGHLLLVNPDHIVMVERNGDGTATIYLSNREYKKVAQTVDDVQELANNEVIVSHETDDKPSVDDEAKSPANKREKKPVTPPETK